MEDYESDEDVVDEDHDPDPSNDQHSPKRSPSSSSKAHHYDDEDSSSTSSSTSNKFKVTVPVAPKFTCADRLERRKEFYAKLEDKHKALEKERLENEARIKEEEEAAIKQLRKSMVPKVNPVPSFYRQGPPPKADLKKIPVTRAKSPKLTRRKSCGDAVKCCEDETRDTKNSQVTPKGKNRINTRKSNENKQVRDHQEDQQEENADDVE
ncbi:hypothetical protein ACS0TY_005720 [Phlomoides rotata]